MAVSVFRISQTTISEYETETRQYPAPAVKLVQEHGKSFFAWLLTKQSVEVELENSKGVPSMFAPHSPVAGPSPDLDIAPPKVIPPSFPTRS